MVLKPTPQHSGLSSVMLRVSVCHRASTECPPPPIVSLCAGLPPPPHNPSPQVCAGPAGEVRQGAQAHRGDRGTAGPRRMAPVLPSTYSPLPFAHTPCARAPVGAAGTDEAFGGGLGMIPGLVVGGVEPIGRQRSPDPHVSSCEEWYFSSPTLFRADPPPRAGRLWLVTGPPRRLRQVFAV